MATKTAAIAQPLRRTVLRSSVALIPPTKSRQQVINSVEKLIERIPSCLERLHSKGHRKGSRDDPVMRLLRATSSPSLSSMNYTRNLITTDHEQYELLLLCWEPGKFSKIHDHPVEGCWMHVLSGDLQETRYNKDLRVTQDTIYSDAATLFIEDTLGYHKVGNPTESLTMTLHLYSPPIQRCQAFDEKDGTSQVVDMVNYSEYGDRLL